ncbi:MAG: hypothetical protein IH867_03185 [Chloroflexi bacterium]|nr:hypothetical protein [Chloroflexota bacterium]
MVSMEIENDPETVIRIERNIPFSCVEMIFDASSAALPKIDLATKCCVWLDYECKVNSDVLTDSTIIADAVHSGSMLFITINVHQESFTGVEAKYLARLRKLSLIEFQESVGPENIPNELVVQDMVGGRFAELSRSLVDSKIRQALMARNSVLPEPEKFVYEQLVNIRYADQASMLTVGGIFYQNQDVEKFAASKFEDLPFTTVNSNPTEPTEISMPYLTQAERFELNKLLPTNSPVVVRGITPEMSEAYGKLYRYYPNFVDAEP